MPSKLVFLRPQKKLVLTKTLLLKHYYRRQGMGRKARDTELPGRNAAKNYNGPKVTKRDSEATKLTKKVTQKCFTKRKENTKRNICFPTEPPKKGKTLKEKANSSQRKTRGSPPHQKKEKKERKDRA